MIGQPILNSQSEGFKPVLPYFTHKFSIKDWAMYRESKLYLGTLAQLILMKNTLCGATHITSDFAS